MEREDGGTFFYFFHGFSYWLLGFENYSSYQLISLLLQTCCERVTEVFNENNCNKKNLKNFMVSFYGWDSTASRLQSHSEETVYFFTAKSPGVLGTHFTNLRIKVRVDFEAAQLFWNKDLWVDQDLQKLHLYPVQEQYSLSFWYSSM